MSTYIKLSTLEYPRHAGDIARDPAGNADYALVEWVNPPQIDRNRQRIAEGAPIRNGKTWLMNWVVTQIPDEEQATKVRQQRTDILRECDWTQLPDAALTDAQKLQWRTYRQALRDISTQAGFPWDVQWPEAPI